MPLPSRLLRSTAVVAPWLLGLLGAAWLLFAILLLVLHGWIVPRIGEWRGALEAQASRVVGTPVRIGSIEARSHGLFPTLELREVVLEDAAQREALKLARVVLSVSPRSVWRLGFEQLYVEKAELEMRRSREGRLFIAGLDLSPTAPEEDASTAFVDWFFSQRELVIAQGSVRWSDEQRGAPPLQLSNVRFVARNGARRHELRVDATPPEGWGARFTLMAQFRQPLLSTQPGDWRRWQGQVYASLPHMDVSRLGQYVTLDARIREGNGTVQAWVDVSQGKPVGLVADLQLSRVDTVLAPGLQPLVLRDLSTRVTAHNSPGFFEFSTQNLQFTTGRGERWPGGNVWFRHEPAQDALPETGALRANQLDLNALALIADRLPLSKEVRRLITERAPQGRVEQVELHWQGPADAPTGYHGKGQVTGLSLKADRPVVDSQGEVPVGMPGIHGLSATFEMNHEGGNAQLRIDQGALEFPGVFADPWLPLDSAALRAQWTVKGEHIALSIPELRFANADAEGTARATWRTSDPAKASSGSRFPGVLDLQGSLSRADGTRVWRYLPLEIPQDTRDYVRDAVRQGTASSVDFRVRGDLWDVPFDNPEQGEFRIAAKVQDVHFAYVPPLTPAQAARAAPDDVQALPWPALTKMRGELVFERSAMRVQNAQGQLAGAPQMEVFKGGAEIADMSIDDPLLTVDAQMRGPLTELTRLGVPLLQGLPEAHTFASGVQGGGGAHYRLQLQLPLMNAENTKVQAQIQLNNNSLQLAPGTPALQAVHGPVRFTESGFSMAGVQAQVAGGQVQVAGEGRWDGPQPDITVNAKGRVSAEGLRGLKEWPWLAQLAAQMEGNTHYTASGGLRDGRPHFDVRSDLLGLSLPWPAPLSKGTTTAWPLQVTQSVSERLPNGHPSQERFVLKLGEGLSAEYLSDVREAAPKLLRGAVRVGGAAVQTNSLPTSGAQVVLALPRVDVDAWSRLLLQAQTPSDAHAGGSSSGDTETRLHPWVPTHFGVHTDELVVGGRTLRQVVLGGSREGPVWQAHVDARELSGHIAYSMRQAGRLWARLSRLKIEASAAEQVESLLDEAPTALPALDIEVSDFELLGRSLGRLDIKAVNRGGATREWRLNHLGLRTPEAHFQAQGRWLATSAAPQAPRQTELDFHLDIQDAGALLTRFGMPGVLLRGQGPLKGQLQWQGSPFAIDFPSLAGQLNLNVQSGQFLKAEPGVAKLLGVVSLQALPRRFSLDFRDIFSAGFAFDFIRGDVRVAKGEAHTNNLQMKGVNAAVLLEGSAHIARETQQLRVVVVPEINAGTAALVATAINPAIGIGAFVAQAVLSKPLVAATTREFEITGTWSEPRVTQVQRNAAAAAAAALGAQGPGQALSGAVAPLSELLPALPSLPGLPSLRGGASAPPPAPSPERRP